MDNRSTESGLASATWVLVGQTSIRVLGLVNTAIAARFVGPDAFGMVALAGMVVALLSIMSSFGLDWALVQRRAEGRDLFDAAWTWHVLLGVLVAGASIALSGVSESLFGVPHLAEMTCVLSLIPVLGGLENIGLVKLRMVSIFRVEVVISLVCKILTIIVTSMLAFFWRNGWALVVGMLVSRLSLTIASFVAHPFRPRFRLSGIDQLASFSLWYYVATVVDFARTRLPGVLIGRFHGAFPVGVYQTGAEISYAPLSEFIVPLSRVAYVRYTALQNDKPALRSTFLITTGATWLMVWPICALTIITANAVVRLVLGPSWNDAVPVIQILAIAAISSSFGATANYLIMAVNEVKTNAARTVVSAVFIVGLAALWIPPYAAIGAAWAVVVGKAISDVWSVIAAIRLVSASWSSLLKFAVRPVIGTIIAALLTIPLNQFVAADEGVAAAIISLVIDASVFLGLFLSVVYMGWRLSGRPDGAETFVARKLADALRLGK